jgi:KDO2-lipid IV(A) lauroyltransferase
MMLENLRWRLEYVGFRIATCVIEILSLQQVTRLARGLAWVFCEVLPARWTRCDVARENLKQAYGDRYTDAELSEIIFGMWVHLFRLVAEIIQFPRKLRLENCREVVVFRNRQAAVRAMNTGRPVFVLGGHFGNWEASTATFGVFGFRMGIVGRKLDNPLLHAWFTKAREATGHRLLLKNGGWDGMADLLQSGGNMGLMCDQDAGRRGIFVDFFGKPASTFRSIALMALEAKAIILVGYGRRLPDDFENGRWARFEIGCEEVIDAAEIRGDDEVRILTERYTQALERAINRSPEQYFWVHRRWKSAPPQRRAKSLRAA